MKRVLDASALLAYLKDEPGADIVEAALAEPAISSVNWTEVVQTMIALGADVSTMLQNFQETGLTIEPFILKDAKMAGRLWSQTKEYGLSLGDHACPSLGLRLEATVLTSDHSWESPNLSIKVQLIR